MKAGLLCEVSYSLDKGTTAERSRRGEIAKARGEIVAKQKGVKDPHELYYCACLRRRGLAQPQKVQVRGDGILDTGFVDTLLTNPEQLRAGLKSMAEQERQGGW